MRGVRLKPGPHPGGSLSQLGCQEIRGAHRARGQGWGVGSEGPDLRSGWGGINSVWYIVSDPGEVTWHFKPWFSLLHSG